MACHVLDQKTRKQFLVRPFDGAMALIVVVRVLMELWLRGRRSLFPDDVSRGPPSKLPGV